MPVSYKSTQTIITSKAIQCNAAYNSMNLFGACDAWCFWDLNFHNDDQTCFKYTRNRKKTWLVPQVYNAQTPQIIQLNKNFNQNRKLKAKSREHEPPKVERKRESIYIVYKLEQIYIFRPIIYVHICQSILLLMYNSIHMENTQTNRTSIKFC